MAINPEIFDFISAQSESVVSEAVEILKTITNKEVELSFDGAEEFAFEELQSNYSESVVEVSFKLASDPDGLVQVFFEKPLAAKIGSLMMMMDEEEPEFNEEHVDAIQETVNQILGAIATSMSEKLGFPISFDQIKGEETELNEESFALPDQLTTKFTLNIEGGDPVPIMSVMTASTVQAAQGETAEIGEEAAAPEEAATEAEVDDAGGIPTEAADSDELSEDELAEIGSALGADFDFGGGDDAGIGGEVEDAQPAAAEMPSAAIPPVPQVSEDEKRISFLMDLKFPVSIELGRTKMLIKDILDLGHGSVIEFDKLANEPVDLLIDEKKVAEGEVVVIDEHFGIRITTLTHKQEFLKEQGI